VLVELFNLGSAKQVKSWPPWMPSASTVGYQRVKSQSLTSSRHLVDKLPGVPPRLPISQEEIQQELDRRRPGQSLITTPRKEEDTCEVLSGVGDGVTLGSPIAILVRNKDQRSQDYGEMSVAYRPSHADATYDFKYGIRAVAGGGRSSARETIGRVAAGAIAKKLLKVVAGTEVGMQLSCYVPHHSLQGLISPPGILTCLWIAFNM